MQPVDALIAHCRAHGMRMTVQRRAIFQYLWGNTKHPTAEEVFQAVQERYPGVSLATVYNTLETLTQMGEIQRLDLGGAAERFDPDVRVHHHFTCSGCGQVLDYFAVLPEDVFAGPPGARVDRVQLHAVGLCADCRKLPLPGGSAKSANPNLSS